MEARIITGEPGETPRVGRNQRWRWGTLTRARTSLACDDIDRGGEHHQAGHQGRGGHRRGGDPQYPWFYEVRALAT